MARVTFNFLDKGQVMIRCNGRYSNVHREKIGLKREHFFLIIEQQDPVALRLRKI